MKKMRGYDIRIQRAGSDWRNEKQHAWGVQGELPEEWEQVKQDDEVIGADIAYATQRRKRADKRKFLDTYTRD